MAIHAAMIHRIDTEIGRVIEQLKAMGAYENTLIIFVSDNGASAEEMVRGSGHDRQAGAARLGKVIPVPRPRLGQTPRPTLHSGLHKSYVHEGGISTPLIVHWPKGIAARGELRTNPGHLIDIAPTLIEPVAGGAWPQVFNGQPVPPPPGKEPGSGLLQRMIPFRTTTSGSFTKATGPSASATGNWSRWPAPSRRGSFTTWPPTGASR